MKYSVELTLSAAEDMNDIVDWIADGRRDMSVLLQRRLIR